MADLQAASDTETAAVAAGDTGAAQAAAMQQQMMMQSLIASINAEEGGSTETPGWVWPAVAVSGIVVLGFVLSRVLGRPNLRPYYL